MYKLVISDDEGKTTVVPLVRDEISIGRKDGNTIRLTERNVSRRHARLRKGSNGSFHVEDLGSYNGVRVNGKRIEQESNLTAGDQIAIGDYLLAIQSEAQVNAAAPLSSTPIPPARLVMLTPPAPGAEYALTRSGMKVGRAEDLDIWVNHRSISREHAEVVREGEGGPFVLRDLGSANGVRVNGEDITRHELIGGDVIELGQVRFRFVDIGETYVFDAERTVQMEALPLPDNSNSSKTPIIFAGAIIALAMGVAAIIALWGDSPDENQAIVTPIGPTESAPEGEVDHEGCPGALKRRDWTDAEARAQAELATYPDDDINKKCLADARLGIAQKETFERGRTALANKEYDDAYTLLVLEADESNPYSDEPEVGRTKELYVSHHLEQARNKAKSSPKDAIRHARLVADLGLSPFDASAVQLIAKLEADSPELASVPAAPLPVARNHHRKRRPRQPSNNTNTVAPEKDPEPPRNPTPPPVRADTRDCTSLISQRTQYSNCIIKKLNGRASSDKQLAQLVAAYLGVNKRGKAHQMMRKYLNDYPTGRKAAQYASTLRTQQK